MTTERTFTTSLLKIIPTENIGPQIHPGYFPGSRYVDADGHLYLHALRALKKVTDLLLRAAHRLSQLELASLQLDSFFNEGAKRAHKQEN